MNKQLFYTCVWFSCLAIILSSCKDNNNDIDGGEDIGYMHLSRFNDLVASEGGTLKIRWDRGFINGFSFCAGEWFMDKSNYKHPIEPYEDVKVSIDNDTIKGDWFTATPRIISHSIFGDFCDEIQVTLAPNTTGKRRFLQIHVDQNIGDRALIFQECEEQLPDQ